MTTQQTGMPQIDQTTGKYSAGSVNPYQPSDPRYNNYTNLDSRPQGYNPLTGNVDIGGFTRDQYGMPVWSASGHMTGSYNDIPSAPATQTGGDMPTKPLLAGSPQQNGTFNSGGQTWPNNQITTWEHPQQTQTSNSGSGYGGSPQQYGGNLFGINGNGSGPSGPSQQPNPYMSSSYGGNNMPYGSAYGGGTSSPNGGSGPQAFQTVPNMPNGAPNYQGVANQQSQYNWQNAQDQNSMNNPNQYGPNGAQVRTRNADGSYSVTQSLSPQMQQQLDQQNSLNSTLGNRAGQLANRADLNFNGAPAAPSFNTSGVRGIPNSDANDLAKTRDSVYNQSTQYLDPQFKQEQSDMESKLANQGIMPGSEAYNREVGNFGLAKQRAYGDARNSAIQAGGAEQSRLFGLGLQSHTTGMNDALAGFNTGLQGRQQGVSEATAMHNSPINDISALRGLPQVQMPTYQGQVGTSIPGVDFLNAANMQNNANLGISNADAASHNNMMNGLFGLGGAALQSGALNGAGGWLNGLFGSGNQYGNFLSSNSGLNLSPDDLGSLL